MAKGILLTHNLTVTTRFGRLSTFLGPLFYAVSPLIFLYSNNVSSFTATDLLISLVFYIIAAAAIFAVIALLLTRFQKRRRPEGIQEQASLFTILFLLFFYVLYGPAKQFLKDQIGLGFQFFNSPNQLLIIGSNKILLPVFVGIFAISINVLRRTKLVLPLNNFFRISGLVLVSLSVMHIGIESNWRKSSMLTSSHDRQAGQHPNIYYIVLDAYTSFDVLKTYYYYDNDNFAHYLVDNGFYVARKSKCNYPVTVLSICSSLNMRYIPYWEKVRPGNAFYLKCINGIRESEAASIMLQNGYSYIPIGHTFFKEGFGKRKNIVSVKNYPNSHHLWFNELSLTPLEPLAAKWDIYFVDRHRLNTLFEFSALEKAIDYPGPKFVFAHILCPHPPYVFHRDGSSTSDIIPRVMSNEVYIARKKMYVEQLEFATHKIRQILNRVVKNDSSAIIVLQSDHSEWVADTLKQPHDYVRDSNFLAQRMPILNAYRVPPEIRKALYDSISPVNSFRIILDNEFGMHAGTLPDNHFVIFWSNQYQRANDDNVVP